MTPLDVHFIGDNQETIRWMDDHCQWLGSWGHFNEMPKPYREINRDEFLSQLGGANDCLKGYDFR